MNTTAFFSYLNDALTPFHAASASQALLCAKGFTPLAPDADRWQLMPGGRYVLKSIDGTTAAFVVPPKAPRGIRVIATHNDSPAFRLKPQPAIVREGCTLLNIEVYGGPILETWLDRALTIAGRVFTKGPSWMQPTSHLIALEAQVTIPSLAIHMKREPNPLNPQNECLALWGSADAPALETRIADTLHVAPEDILAHELYLVSGEKAAPLGADGKWYAASRIDNLANAYAATAAIGEAENNDHLLCFISYQHEEIGSRSRQGAASMFLSQLLARIQAALTTTDRWLQHGTILSCDQAHAVHPLHPQKADPILRPRLGEGPVLKLAANHSYATTPRGEAMLRALCAEENIPLQTFANRADMRGGSTIGPIAEVASHFEAIDVGSPMLAMHAIRELAHLDDQAQMERLMTAFLAK